MGVGKSREKKKFWLIDWVLVKVLVVLREFEESRVFCDVAEVRQGFQG